MLFFLLLLLKMSLWRALLAELLVHNECHLAHKKRWQKWQKFSCLGNAMGINLYHIRQGTYVLFKNSFYEMVVNNFVYSRTWKAFKNNCNPINQIVCGLLHGPLVKCLLLYIPLSPPQLCDVSTPLQFYTVFMSLCQESCVFKTRFLYHFHFRVTQ